MVTGQAASVGIYRELERQNNLPGSMTFETNGTQVLKEPFKEWIKNINTEVFFSVRPKRPSSQTMLLNTTKYPNQDN